MKISFILPQSICKPAGGYKTVYQYANYFIEYGHEVSIYFCSFHGENSKHIPPYIMFLIRKFILLKEPKWFDLHSSVKKKAIWDIGNDEIDDGDFIICTSIHTSLPTFQLDNDKGIKIHLIQDHENWFLSDEDVFHKYMLPMINISVSNYVKNLVDSVNPNKSYLLENGIDTKVFRIKKSINKRDNLSVVMMWKANCRKKSELGLTVLKRLKIIFPELQVTFFSVDNKPDYLPSWIKYSYRANEEELVNIYNDHAIYLCTSEFEGFGLPGLEASASGCALVTTDCLEYAKHLENALVSPVNDEEKLFRNLKSLLDDNDLRIRMAKAAYENSLNYSLENSSKKFLKILENNYEGN